MNEVVDTATAVKAQAAEIKGFEHGTWLRDAAKCFAQGAGAAGRRSTRPVRSAWHYVRGVAHGVRGK